MRSKLHFRLKVNPQKQCIQVKENSCHGNPKSSKFAGFYCSYTIHTVSRVIDNEGDGAEIKSFSCSFKTSARSPPSRTGYSWHG